MAAAHLPRSADNPTDAEVNGQGCSLFLDSEPEITNSAIPEGFTLDGTQKPCYNAVTQTEKPACS